MNGAFSRHFVDPNSIIEYLECTRSVASDCRFFRQILSAEHNSDDTIERKDVENFVLNLMLPLPMVGSLVYNSRKLILDDRVTLPTDGRPKGISDFVAGSSTDGLCLPEMIHTYGDKYYMEFPDLDIKFVFDRLIVDPRRRDTFAIPEQADCPPGYTFLIYKTPTSEGLVNKKAVDGYMKDLDPNLLLSDKYIDRVQLGRFLRQRLKMSLKNKDKEIRDFLGKDGHSPNVQFSQRGPATSVDIDDSSQHLRFSKDYVVALPCPKWPKQAAEWPRRKRIWPPRGIVKKVIKEGCHVVLKGSKLRSDNREFLYSFSMCERTLSQSLNLCQRRSYVLLKLIFKFYIDKAKRGLTTYMCKTVLFWACETCLATNWTENNTSECLGWLLDALAEYLKKGCLPNYFIPANNMILHLSQRSVEACLQDVEKVKANLIGTLLQISEHHRFFWISRDISLARLLTPLVADDSATSRTLQQTTLQFVSFLLDGGEISETLSILSGTWACEVELDTIQYIRQLEDVLDNIQSHDVDHWVCVKGLLAILYHQKSEEAYASMYYYEWDTNAVLSVESFFDIIDKVGRYIWIIGAFYNLLAANNDIVQIKGILRHYFTYLHLSERTCDGFLYEPEIYSSVTESIELTTTPYDFTVDPVMFSVPSTAYILFKVIMAYKKLAKKVKCKYRKNALFQEAKKVFLHLYKWKLQKCAMFPEITDEHLCYLVGIAASAVGESAKSHTLFEEAKGYGVSYILMNEELVCREEIEDKNSIEEDIGGNHPARRNQTTHPYVLDRRLRKRSRKRQGSEFTFKGGKIPRQSFTHN